MKKLSRILSVCLCLCLLALSLAGCGGAASSDGKQLKIGIIQYMSHPSLDNCYEGIVKGLEASGLNYTAERQIGSSTSAAADCSTFAQNMVAKGCDMIIAIGHTGCHGCLCGGDRHGYPADLLCRQRPGGRGAGAGYAEPRRQLHRHQ